MASGLLFMGLIVGGVIIGGLIFILSLYREDEEDYYDDTIFRNFMPQYSNGYAIGKITKRVQGNKRIGFYFLPTDIDKFRVKKKKEKIEEQGPVWVSKKQIKTIPKGDLSSRRNEIWVFPPSIKNLPSENIKRFLGETILNEIEENTQKEQEDKILRNKIKRQNDFLDKSEGFRIAEDSINVMDESYKKALKTFLKEDKKGFFDSQTGPSHS